MPFLHIVPDDTVRRLHFLQVANREVRGIAFKRYLPA